MGGCMENKVIIAGVDTIEIGYCIQNYDEIVIHFEDLVTAKELAQSTQGDNDFSGVEINAILFKVQRTGSRNYDYILINEDMTLRISTKAKSGYHYPEVMISYRAEFLWRVGWQNAIDSVRKWLDTWAIVCSDKVSRLDVCCDIQMPLPVLDNALDMISTRAKSKDIKSEFDMQYSKRMFGKRVTGYVVGSNQLMCRIYDKSYEIKKHQKFWFNDLWLNNGADTTDDITRVEFQCRRKMLRDLKIDSTFDLRYLISTLWDYLTVKWLRIVEKVAGKNRQRIDNHPFWDLVIKATDKFGIVYKGFTRMRIVKPKAELLAAQARGCLVSIGALGGVIFSKHAAEQGVKTVEEFTKKIVKDKQLEIDIYNRMYKVNSFPPTLLTGGLISTDN